MQRFSFKVFFDRLHIPFSQNTIIVICEAVSNHEFQEQAVMLFGEFLLLRRENAVIHQDHPAFFTGAFACMIVSNLPLSIAWKEPSRIWR